MIAANDLCDFVDGFLAEVFAQCAHVDAVEIGLCGYALHDGGVGCYEYVVLVHAPVVVAF